MKNIFMIIILGLALTGCNREGENHPCYDSSLVKDNGCATDCPGFEGCDVKTYCNECMAARHGIGPK